jgi:phosphogluconate dehydratase
MKQAVVDVTRRIRERSAAARRDHLARIDVMLARPRGADRLGCANLAHATAALPRAGKLSVVAARAPNLEVVTASNDVLSAHQPYERFPAVIRATAHALGATAQVAGGVPAMCEA